MYKRHLAILLTSCFLLTGCNVSCKVNSAELFENSSNVSLTESSSSSSTSSKPVAAPVATINCKAYGISADVTGVKYTSSPNSVTMQFTVGELFTIQETIKFKTEKVETSEGISDETPVSTITTVTCSDTITLGTLKNVNECLDYLDALRLADTEFSSSRNKYVASLAEPNLLRKAPLTSYTECKAYCEQLYKELSEELEANQAIVDGATGIIYHTRGGNKFTLADYRLHLSRGESTKIEIQNLPDGFSLEDVTFHSDRVGYASVTRDGTVTGNRNGTANITVSLKGAAVYCTVYVQVI